MGYVIIDSAPRYSGYTHRMMPHVLDTCKSYQEYEGAWRRVLHNYSHDERLTNIDSGKEPLTGLCWLTYELKETGEKHTVTTELV